MRLVDRPFYRPLRCAALPYVGQTHPQARWIDCGVEMEVHDGHIYLSSVAVDEAMRLLGYPSRGQYSVAVADAKAAEARALAAEAEVEALREQLAAVQVLKNSGVFEQARRPGRPPNKEKVSA